MGKTENGAVWLNEDMLSAYDYWQFWRNTEDANVEKFLKLFTDLPLDQITELSKLEGQYINEAKVALADEATKLCHSKEAADLAKATAQKTFEKKSIGDNLPEYYVNLQELEDGYPLCKLLTQSGFAQSKSAARKLIQGRGARINNEVIEDINYNITLKNFNDKFMKLSSGKKNHMIIKLL
jgi:tyrosyl-tRNA synthetase